MSEYIFPVGFPVGLTFEPGGTSETAAATVRLGDEYYDMTTNEYLTWLACTVNNTPESFKKAAKERGLKETSEIMDSMLHTGLLVYMNSDDENFFDTLRKLRLISLGVGAGNNPKTPEKFEIYDLDWKPRVSVNIFIYTLWSTSYRSSIWKTCQELSDGEDGIEVAKSVLDNLPTLIRTSTAYLDTMS